MTKSDKITIGSHSFNTLVAITDEERADGLMFHLWPPPIMSFPFKQASVRKFWMKNTLSPLDIVFCLKGSVVGIYHGEPLSLDYVGPDEPVDLVIEFPAGTAYESNICVGSDVKLFYSTETLSKKIRNNLIVK